MAVDAGLIIRKLLVDNAAVSALVGSQVYPQSAPETAVLPYIVYNRIDGEHLHQMTAASGLVRTLIQVDSFSKDYLQMVDLADKSRLALDGFQNTSVTVGGDTARVDSIWLQDNEDGFERPTDATDEGFHRRIQDYEIFHDEVVPTFP